ncbi:hypothetical protein HU200_055973 [Digitaria exilis]|uniref:Reverse transcriptase zinc-binding domain-containing protein n=1 Tax=Digitaria exilis TaxID=1010633 RepID=A0A835AHG4_9POAL|nr:hypothetical protein HU200_055973 [Digitaria exilis]
MRVWRTKLPTKVKFFGWLLTHGRVNCRAYLHRRNICTRKEDFCETCSDVLETANHIFFQCPIALRFWRLVGFHHTDASVANHWLLGRELQLPSQVQYDAVLVLLWHLWKARNAKIFDNLQLTEEAILRHTLSDMDLWRPRFKDAQDLWGFWRHHFSTCL